MVRGLLQRTGTLLLLAAMVACSRNPAEPANEASVSPPAQPGSTDDPCGSARLLRFVGQPDTPQNRAAITAAAAPHPLRWVRPGNAVTEDYAPGRANILIGQSGLIRSVRCG